MLQITPTYELGNTIYFEGVYRNISGVLTDPTNPGWTIKTGRGVTSDSSDDSGGPTKRSTGIWYIFWTSSETGDYVLDFTGSIGSYAMKKRILFKVVDTSRIY